LVSILNFSHVFKPALKPVAHIVTPVRKSVGARRTADWRQAVRSAIRDPEELCRRLDLPAEYVAQARAAGADFPLFAPLSFVARMKTGDPHDPLLRQVLPLVEELADVHGFGRDPVGDGASQLEPGIIQKYGGRALLILTGACPVHCRYCFRRHYPYSEGPRSIEQWAPVIERLATDESLDEVILSGGDPLMLADEQLAELADRLASLRHVKRLRIHSRMPIVVPERVDDSLLGWLRGTRLTPIVVVHANHPAEIGERPDDPVAAALARLVDAGIPVLNQAVLLRGVNDEVEVLAELCRRLVNLRVMPYYLHQLDRVAGAAHFEVPLERAQAIARELRERLPGYAVPRLVAEIAGEPSKSWLV
jgi:EF-P beta-lysylation protein EpmB